MERDSTFEVDIKIHLKLLTKEKVKRTLNKTFSTSTLQGAVTKKDGFFYINAFNELLIINADDVEYIQVIRTN